MKRLEKVQHRTAIHRRELLRRAVSVAALGTIAPAGIARAFGQGGGAAAAPPPPARGTQLVLLGTQGGPNVNVRRSQASNAVVVDGRPYLVDCGYGAIRSLVAAGIGYAQLGTGFITHLHDDHTADIAALLSLQWTGSKMQPTDIYGPFGTAAMIDAAIAFAKANTDIRITDEGRKIRPEQLFHGHDIAAEAAPVQVFKDDRLTVTAVENTHFPDRAKAVMRYRSVAYRVQTESRSIVFSGDTAYSKNLVGLARDADFFVCELIDQPQYRGQPRGRSHAGGGWQSEQHRPARRRDALEQRGCRAHGVGSRSEDRRADAPAAREQSQRGRGVPDSSYIEGVRKVFSGQVIVGRDLMVL